MMFINVVTRLPMMCSLQQIDLPPHCHSPQAVHLLALVPQPPVILEENEISYITYFKLLSPLKIATTAFY